MGAVDPTYTLYPIAAIIAAVLLLLVFLSNFIRQSWNLAVAFLCFWLFFENLTFAINAILWSDNANIKLYVYCDIVSHLQIIAGIVKPMSTLLIMRRLYLIASLRSVDLPSKAARRWDKSIEWALGLAVPILVGGPVYYSIQHARFLVEEGFGCTNAAESSLASLLLLLSWPVVAPLLAVILYYPRVAIVLYRQSREFNEFLRSNPSISRTNYIRILVLATFNICIMLFLNIAVSVSTVLSTNFGPPKLFPFYPGWGSVHHDESPVASSWAAIKASGPLNVAFTFLARWASILVSFAIFGLFGLPQGSYWRAFSTVVGWVRWKPTWRGRRSPTRSVLSTIGFIRNAAPQEISLASCELGFPHIDNTRRPPDAGVESENPPEDAVSEPYKSASSICQHSNDVEGVKQEPSELDTETVDIGEVSLSRYSSVVAV